MPPSDIQTRDLRIVIVDDEPLVREVLRARFQEEGFAVIGDATNGKSAIDLVVRLEPDVVVLDLLMPGLTGMETIGALLELCDELDVVVYTALEGEAQAAALAAGATAVVDKVDGDNRLVEEVRRIELRRVA